MRVSDHPSVTAPALISAPPLAEIALVGGASAFSDNLVQATGRHFRDLHLIHLPSIEALAALASFRTRWLRLLVIDERTASSAPPALVRSVVLPPATRYALAFHDPALASGFYGDPAKPLPIDSYVPLNVRLDIWLSILRLLLLGGRYVPEELLAHQHHDGLSTPQQRAPCKAHLGLTRRQYSVLELVAAGHPNKVIANRLGVSDHTVKLHIHNIIGRLGVTNRTQAAARFYDGPG